jgi:hypothetical protein
MNSEDVKTRSEWVYWCNGCSVRRVESPSLLCSYCKLEIDLAAANKRIRRLEEAGDALFQQFHHPTLQTHQWTKAKEAKA